MTACFHTGYFLLRTLRPLADASLVKGDDDNLVKEFSNYVDDFCDKQHDVLPLRTQFVKAINGIEDPSEFQTACFDHLGKDDRLNSWFDPIDPLSSITQKEICDLHYKLFSSLRQKQRTSVAEYVSFSYLASLDLFLNAHMQEDMENCVNTKLAHNTGPEVTDFISHHPAFKNWHPEKMINV